MNCLPAELMLNVIFYLSRDDVSECLMVCQSWYAIISPIYYQKLQVSLSHQEFIKQTEEVRIDGKKLGDFARSIILSDLAPIPVNGNEFCRVLDNLPHLRTIHFDSGLAEYAYLMESIDVDKLKYVQEMTAKVHVKDIKHIYLSNKTVLKDKLTKLHITNHIGDIARILRLGGHKRFFDILASFKSLQHLRIVNQDIHMPNYYKSVLNSCTNLLSLRLESICSCSFPDFNFKKHENLESLELTIEYGYRAQHVDNIINNLPHLKNLKLSLIHAFEPDTSLFDLNCNLATRFLSYLQKVTRFTFEEVKEYNENSLSGREDLFMVQDKCFWKYIRVLVGEGYVCNLKMQLKQNCSTNRTFITVDRQKKTIGIINGVWFGEDVIFDEDWLNALNFLTFHSITIVNNDICCEEEDEQFEHYERVLNPLISKLKNTHHSSFIRIKETFTLWSTNYVYIVLKFVSKNYFEYMQQNQPRKEDPQGSSNTNNIQNAAENLLKKLELTLGERVVQGTASLHDIDYFVERN